VQDFAKHINDYLGEMVYSKDAMYRMDSKGAKVTAEFMLHVSQAFDMPINDLYEGKTAISQEDLNEPPPLGMTDSIQGYKSYLAHAKGMAGDKPNPVETGLMEKSQQMIADMEAILKQNERMRGMVEMARLFVGDAQNRNGGGK